MKKLTSFVAAAAIVFGFAACEPKGPSTFSLTVNVSDATVDSPVGLPDAYTVTVTNTSTLVSTELETENGTAVFEGLVAGVYDVNVSATLADGGSTFIFAGTSKAISVLQNVETTVSVAVSKSSALIFKEIYYCGAPGDSYYFRDQFYEIYNQSDATVYADGLCIAETFYANYDFSLFYEWDIANPSDYVFAQKIWQVKGSGTEYPIAPGESIVIAQWAVDHRRDDLSKGMSPVDLSGAEFEAVIEESTTWNGIVLTDNAAINMEMAVNASGYNTPQWLTSVSGSSYIIFNPSTPLKNDEFVLATNTEATVAAREVAIADILDAVQAGSDETRASTLGLPAVLDAGFQYLGASYLGKSIARKKTGETEDGRPIFQDTNNTTADFEIFDTPEVRRYGAGVPSWNTWIK